MAIVRRRYVFNERLKLSGYQLGRVQLGKQFEDWKPMPGIEIGVLEFFHVGIFPWEFFRCLYGLI